MCPGVPVPVGLLSGRVTVIFKYLTAGVSAAERDGCWL